jgi:ATP-dependent helicase/nuclease subunit A
LTRLNAIPGLESALAAVRDLPPARYTEEEWEIVKACFTLLRHAAAQLQVVFAEAGAVDYIEVAQIAQRVLRGDDGLPTDAAMAVADGIRHLLVDEFQDTSRRQHELLAASSPPGLSANRPHLLRGRRPHAIHLLLPRSRRRALSRVKAVGLEIPHDEPLLFDFVPLRPTSAPRLRWSSGSTRSLPKVFEVPTAAACVFFRRAARPR